MTTTRKMLGVVTGVTGHYYRIETNGPAHLRDLDLIPRQMGPAKVGDLVELAYVTTPSSGLWNVSRVLATAVLT